MLNCSTSSFMLSVDATNFITIRALYLKLKSMSLIQPSAALSCFDVHYDCAHDVLPLPCLTICQLVLKCTQPSNHQSAFPLFVRKHVASQPPICTSLRPSVRSECLFKLTFFALELVILGSYVLTLPPLHKKKKLKKSTCCASIIHVMLESRCLYLAVIMNKP